MEIPVIHILESLGRFYGPRFKTAWSAFFSHLLHKFHTEMSVIPMDALSIFSNGTAMGETLEARREYSSKLPAGKDHSHSAYFCIPNA